MLNLPNGKAPDGLVDGEAQERMGDLLARDHTCADEQLASLREYAASIKHAISRCTLKLEQLAEKQRLQKVAALPQEVVTVTAHRLEVNNPALDIFTSLLERKRKRRRAHNNPWPSPPRRSQPSAGRELLSPDEELKEIVELVKLEFVVEEAHVQAKMPVLEAYAAAAAARYREYCTEQEACAKQRRRCLGPQPAEAKVQPAAGDAAATAAHDRAGAGVGA